MVHSNDFHKYSIKELMGFHFQVPSVLTPKLKCPHNTAITETNSSSIFSLTPLYNTIIYPIYEEYNDITLTEKTFHEMTGISLKDFMVFVEKGRIIPYFQRTYARYDPEFIKVFLEPGLPRISYYHMLLLRQQNNCKAMNRRCDECALLQEKSFNELKPLIKRSDDGETRGCAACFSMLLASGVNKDAILKSQQVGTTICSLVEASIAKNMGTALKTNCTIAKNALDLLSAQTNPEILDAIVKGLKVSYSPDLDLESYLNLLDGKTTKAIKQITEKILSDPFAREYTDVLNAKLFEYNREIEEVSKSRSAKFYHAISDIAVYSAKKAVENAIQSDVKIEKKTLHESSEWIGSKLMDAQAKVTGKDWTIAQIYRMRCKLSDCKKVT